MIEFGRTMIQARLAQLDQRGASAVEYGLLVAGIAAVIVVVVIALGGKIKGAFSDTCTAISGSGTCS